LLQFNGNIEAVLVFERPLTLEERTKLFTMGEWEWSKFINRVGSLMRTTPSLNVALSRTTTDLDLDATRGTSPDTLFASKVESPEPLHVTRHNYLDQEG
jgi:hypothetical protein